MRILSTLLLYLVCLLAGAQTDTPAQISPAAAPADTITIINSPDTPAPDDIYEDESVVIEHDEFTNIAMPSDLPDWLISENINKQLVRLGDTSHKAGIVEFAVPAGIFALSAMFVRTPWMVHWREVVQKHISQHGRYKTHVDDWLQYSPMVAAYALHFCGMKGQHNLLDRTILLAMSYATFGVVNYAMKTAFKEKRPDSNARNSFPSGHTGTAFMGAEYLRREYWDTNKWVAMSGYVVGVGIAYLRMHNDRHWFNDVIGGAALGYLSTTFAYWIYPKIFHKRTRMHRDVLLQRIAPVPEKKGTAALTWTASPFVGGGSYGVAASIAF